MIIVGCKQGFDLPQGLHVFAAEGNMAVIVIRELIACAGAADRIEIDVLSGGLTLFENRGIRDQCAVFEVDHAFGNCQERDLFRKYRKNLVTEPVETEAADTAQDQVCTFQCLLQLLDLIVFDSVMQGSLQGDMEIVLAKASG